MPPSSQLTPRQRSRGYFLHLNLSLQAPSHECRSYLRVGVGNGGVNEGARGFLYVCVFEGGFDLPPAHPRRSEPQRSGQLPVGVAQEAAAPATSVGALLTGNDAKHGVAWRDGLL